MAKTGGTQVNIGIGLESTAGTAVSATHYPKWTEFSLQAVAEKEMLTSARGLRIESSDSMIKRRYSQGDLAIIPNGDIAPVLFYLALGSLSTGTVSDGTYPHTITVQNANASMKTGTVLVEEGGIQTARYANVVCNTLNLEVSDSYATLTAGLIGGFPDTGSISESYSQENEYAYHQMEAFFGTSISNAEGNSATPLKSFKLNINNNVLVDEAFLSGANTPVAGGFCAGRLQVTGSYSLHFSDTTELAKYKANTKNALEVVFTGAVTGGGSTNETITIKLGKIILTAPPIEYNIGGILVLNQEFAVEYDATDGDISVVVVNDTASY